jgi:hypothetical protein
MLYLVSYDLDKPVQNYPKLIEVLKGLGGREILRSDWLVPSNLSPGDLFNKINGPGGLDTNDRLFVGELHNSAAWRNLLIDDTVTKKLFTDHARP